MGHPFRVGVKGRVDYPGHLFRGGVRGGMIAGTLIQRWCEGRNDYRDTYSEVV
jgi:hypothetical protein